MTDGDDDMPWRKYRHIDPRRSYVHAVHTIGRRGLIFSLLGVLAAAQGGAEIVEGKPLLGAAWLVAGGVAVIWSRKPQGHDKPAAIALYLAFGSLVIESIARFALWFVSDWIAERLLPYGLAEQLPHSSPAYILSIIGYGALLVVIVTVAGWRENLPPRTPHAKHR